MNNDVSKQGYKFNSPYRNNPYLVIDSKEGVITMDGVNKPLVVTDVKYGETKVLPPNSGNHSFKGDKMLEIPLDKITKKVNNITENLNDITKMSYKPTDKKLWKDVFDKVKLQMGGYAQPNEIMQTAFTKYARKRGGFIFNPSNDGKMLPYLKQDGGSITEGGQQSSPSSISQSTEQTEPSPKEVEATNSFDTWIGGLLDSPDYNKLPDNLKDELEYFQNDVGSRSKLTEDYVKRYIPRVYDYWENSGLGMAKPNVNKDIVDFRNKPYAPEATLEEMKTPSVSSEGIPAIEKQPTMQEGGNIQKKFNLGVGRRIKYREGGTIKEGVIKSYDPQTGKIRLY